VAKVGDEEKPVETDNSKIFVPSGNPAALELILRPVALRVALSKQLAFCS